MGTMVIEVPEALKSLGEAMAESLAAVRRIMASAGSGKSVDYAEVEVAIGAASARIERASHENVLRRAGRGPSGGADRWGSVHQGWSRRGHLLHAGGTRGGGAVAVK